MGIQLLSKSQNINAKQVFGRVGSAKCYYCILFLMFSLKVFLPSPISYLPPPISAPSSYIWQCSFPPWSSHITLVTEKTKVSLQPRALRFHPQTQILHGNLSRDREAVTEAKNKMIMNVSWSQQAQGGKQRHRRGPKSRDPKDISQSRGEEREGKSTVWGPGHKFRQWPFKKLIKILLIEIRLHAVYCTSILNSHPPIKPSLLFFNASRQMRQQRYAKN